MSIIGISGGNHNASISVVSGDQILFASEAERYSKIKNDRNLHPDLLKDVFKYADPDDSVVFFEKPFKRLTRQLFSGENIQFGTQSYLQSVFPNSKIHYVGHHESHAAGGFYTSPFESAVVIVVDTIGEWTTTSVWHGHEGRLKLLAQDNYPNSLGLFYSAFTHYLGFKPNEEESTMMDMSAFGRSSLVTEIMNKYVEHIDTFPFFRMKTNFHIGLRNWTKRFNPSDMSASVQYILEECLKRLFWNTKIQIVRGLPGSNNVVYSGEVALNYLANSKLLEEGMFDKWWIMPHPGDGGSSLGAALAYKQKHVEWKGSYLGRDIEEPLDIQRALINLESGYPVAIAHGRAEFGPKSLGNRSIFADPRNYKIKKYLIKWKERQDFRPFSPIILEEYANDYFEMNGIRSPYKQFAFKYKHPYKLESIMHIDGTSVVQTINRFQNPIIYDLLKKWNEKTGCPMLLNTSLGDPIINDKIDLEIMKWSKPGIKYN